MKIYKITLGDDKILDQVLVLYFEEKESAEMVMREINSILGLGRGFEWKCEVVSVISHEEAVKDYPPGMMAHLYKNRSNLKN